MPYLTLAVEMHAADVRPGDRVLCGLTGSWPLVTEVVDHGDGTATISTDDGCASHVRPWGLNPSNFVYTLPNIEPINA